MVRLLLRLFLTSLYFLPAIAVAQELAPMSGQIVGCKSQIGNVDRHSGQGGDQIAVCAGPWVPVEKTISDNFAKVAAETARVKADGLAFYELQSLVLSDLKAQILQLEKRLAELERR